MVAAILYSLLFIFVFSAVIIFIFEIFKPSLEERTGRIENSLFSAEESQQN